MVGEFRSVVASGGARCYCSLDAIKLRSNPRELVLDTMPLISVRERSIVTCGLNSTQAFEML